MSSSSQIKACQVCGSESLAWAMAVGNQFVSDFVTRDKVFSGERVPITLLKCNACDLVQQKFNAPQEYLYKRHYWYRSGTTETMRKALADVVEQAMGLVVLPVGSFVLDIGSNDGTLLSYYPQNVSKVGVEPAENMRQFYVGPNAPTLISDFWSYASYENRVPVHRLALNQDGELKPRIVTALGMLYDLPDPNPFLADVARVLHKEGVFVTQLMCLKQTIQNLDIGNFCHEHLEFYSLQGLLSLLEKHGLTAFRIEENSINGGSYRLYCCHTRKLTIEEWHQVEGFLIAEEELGLDNLGTYFSLSARLKKSKKRTMDYLRGKFANGANIQVYGASTKGNVILQYYGLAGKEFSETRWGATKSCIVDCAVDVSEEKQGLYTAGSGIRIVSPQESLSRKPDVMLVLPYAFRQEFLRKEEKLLQRGVEFVFPLPEFEVVRS